MTSQYWFKFGLARGAIGAILTVIVSCAVIPQLHIPETYIYIIPTLSYGAIQVFGLVYDQLKPILWIPYYGGILAYIPAFILSVIVSGLIYVIGDKVARFAGYTSDKLFDVSMRGIIGSVIVGVAMIVVDILIVLYLISTGIGEELSIPSAGIATTLVKSSPETVLLYYFTEIFTYKFALSAIILLPSEILYAWLVNNLFKSLGVRP